ncbi:MAG: sensor histidine kinase [Runella sp.]
MKNPIVGKNSLAFVLYWLMVALLWGGFTQFFYHFSFATILFDALLSFGLLACIFVVLWQPIRYFKPKYTTPTTVFINHFLLISLVLLIWTRVCTWVVDGIFELTTDYFKLTIPLKIVLAVFSYILYVLLIQVYESQQQQEQQKEAELKLTHHLKETELAVLRNQLNPHFLFNSLNSINSLILIDPEKARQMVIKLSDFLRYNVANTQNQKVTLQKELDMSEAFLEIEKIRFGSRIAIEMDIAAETYPLLIPSLLLQPLFENALKYGLYDSTGQERITLKTTISEDKLLLQMTNSFDDALPTKIGTKSGLRNIKERLQLMYADHATLITHIQENIFTVKIFIPIES